MSPRRRQHKTPTFPPGGTNDGYDRVAWSIVSASLRSFQNTCCREQGKIQADRSVLSAFFAMLSFRSVLGASTGTLRQFLPSLSRQSFARSFSQLSRLSLTNGLRSLRSRKDST